jgi:murein DD-endopeptidase MepM/ murein hydrolase activator NlpD
MPIPFVVPLAAAIAGLLASAPCWNPPVDAPVTDPYRAPPCTWCPGNRGIEYGPRPGQTVTAVAAGTVTFAGSVAGTRYVVVDHADGIRATYGRLATTDVRRGQAVAAGDPIGTTTDGFYFGLRRGLAPDDRPVDPTPMLGVRRYPARLVPLDGTAAPPVGSGRLTCPKSPAGR